MRPIRSWRELCTVLFLSAVRAVAARCEYPFALRPGLSQENVNHTKEMTKEIRKERERPPPLGLSYRRHEVATTATDRKSYTFRRASERGGEQDYLKILLIGGEMVGISWVVVGFRVGGITAGRVSSQLQRKRRPYIAPDAVGARLETETTRSGLSMWVGRGLWVYRVAWEKIGLSRGGDVYVWGHSAPALGVIKGENLCDLVHTF